MPQPRCGNPAKALFPGARYWLDRGAVPAVIFVTAWSDRR
jgi:hypothetical protein